MSPEQQPLVSVVVPTHDRPDRLRRLLASLRAQSIELDSFEVIVVDDASGEETRSLLNAEEAADGLNLRTIRRDRSGGPAAARNHGWRAARAPLVAFTDDDCVADPAWLKAGLAAADQSPEAIVQGRTEPDPAEMTAYGPFSHTLRIAEPTPWFETCNAFYPRHLIERVDGFDEEAFPRAGEDGDLAWRVIESGAGHVFADDARVLHAVANMPPLVRIRKGALRSDAMVALARHPELRRRHAWRRIFWDRHHELFLRALVALLLPRRLGPVAIWLAAPYVKFLTERRTGPLLAPYLVTRDLVEVTAVIRGGVRTRTFLL